MDAAAERRDHQTRVPLDNVLVEIAPEGFDETFEADAVNLGAGGLSMRSAILPDIGARLRCRFESPHDGAAVDADCEVVWAEDAGPNLGEFGLKFTDMTGSDANSIAALVDAWHEALAESMPNGSGGRVTLHLEGVGQPVDAEMIHRATDALLVEQALPFLKVGTGIEEGGRTGRLEAVDLRMEGETPKLILTIGYAATDPSGVLAFDAEDEDEAGSTLLDAPAPPEAFDFDAFEDDSESHGDNPRSVPELVRYDLSSEPPPAMESEDDEAIAALRPSPKQRLDAASKSAKIYWGKTRIAMIALWTRMAPTARAWWARAKHFGGSIVRRTGPWLADLKKRIGRKSETSRTKRTTRAPKRSTAAPKSSSDASPRRRLRLRWWLVVAIAGIGIAVVGRADPAIVPTGDKLPKPVAEPELGDSGATLDLDAVGSEPQADSGEELEAQDAPVLELGDVEPATPRAMPEASRNAGRIPAPSFPSLGDAQRPAAPGTVPSESPYSVDVRDSVSTSFGESRIDGGQEFRIRLSAEARGLHGETSSDGFTVIVVGARAEEGARRIASVHPGVERARIDNEGSQATLTLKFVTGQSPAYRVHVRGNALYVTLGG